MSSTDSGLRGAVRKQEATDISCSGLGHEESAAGFKWQVKGTIFTMMLDSWKSIC